MSDQAAQRIVRMWRDATRNEESQERLYRISLTGGDYESIRLAYEAWRAAINYEIGVGNIVSEVLTSREIEELLAEIEEQEVVA